MKAYPPFGYLEEPHRPYFVMDYLAGGSFSDYLRSGGLMTFGQAAEFIANVCSSLHFAHQRGIIHRDLKPANIFLRERDVPQSAVLTDFGIAKMVYQAQMTNLFNQPGTPEYMSPEQFQAQEATQLSDQYALGIIMYWMMTRRLPFRLSDPTPIAIQHINAILPLPSYINPDVTPAIDRVVMQALSKDPFHRFPDMSQLALAFSQAVHTARIENVPINALGGNRPPVAQDTGYYMPSTGVLRLPGPMDAVHQSSGPSVKPSEVGASTPLEPFSSPNKVKLSHKNNDIRFSAYFPPKVKINRKSGLYVYAYTSLTKDAVEKDVEKYIEELGGNIPIPREANQTVRLEMGTRIKVVLECDELELEPQSLIKTWRNDWTRFEFEIIPTTDLANKRLFIRVSIRVEEIEIAHIKCAIEITASEETLDSQNMEVAAYSSMPSRTVNLSNPLAMAKFQVESTTPYQRIFISYSRRDSNVARAFKTVQTALGYDVFLDVDNLRTGENWRAALAKAIDQADIFQLSWSTHSAGSEYCRYEWEYTLAYRTQGNSEGFIRPVYWFFLTLCRT